ncbi:hypothetical protein NSK_008332 [Nannochloropsis salina CCMP1776]|uniref:Nudix hydrolase domain-containing protein n=1 Tax=Nannochloropsis salina CCMP1776 TaxID=1027361 RepID=A0A4D9CQL7_9STRA|nr:hypothetical protein NSK_008332 [Nannochloropsis salina CCMP1776]|eukprot:TFJ80327.1 hypothetical protein NSK_008332 [Nannochloropsis salina CCMP1776]
MFKGWAPGLGARLPPAGAHAIHGKAMAIGAEVVPVVSTSFGVCEIHKVKAEDGSVLDGWLWFDEKDQINVLVRLEAEAGTGAGEGMTGGEEDRKFLVFEQKKYGYQGLSLAPIGGLVEPGEDALMAAKRELLEEAGLGMCMISTQPSCLLSIVWSLSFLP